MSQTVDNAFVKQYESEVHMAYQRHGSLFRGTIRTKNNIKGESTTFQKVGKGTASSKTRHGDVPVMNIDHTPVECALSDHYAADYIDKLDELKVNHNEREVTVKSGAAALGRKTDELIIASLDSASSYTTSANLSAVALSTMSGAVTTLGARDVPMTRGDVFGAVSWELWNALLGIDAFNKSDYIGDDLPLKQVMGEARFWMGVIWFPHSGLTKAADVRKNFVYHRSAAGHAIGADVMTDITWQGTKAAYFANNMMSQGSCLIDGEGVQQILIDESA